MGILPAGFAVDEPAFGDLHLMLQPLRQHGGEQARRTAREAVTAE
jgi:hypothetical protein